MDSLEDAILSGSSFVVLPISEWTKSQDNFLVYGRTILEFNTLRDLKATAQGYEKSGNLEGAYANYEQLLMFVATAKFLKLNNYSHDINRMRIVAKKLKRSREYEDLLGRMKLPYPTTDKK